MKDDPRTVSDRLYAYGFNHMRAPTAHYEHNEKHNIYDGTGRAVGCMNVFTAIEFLHWLDELSGS